MSRVHAAPTCAGTAEIKCDMPAELGDIYCAACREYHDRHAQAGREHFLDGLEELDGEPEGNYRTNTRYRE